MKKIIITTHLIRNCISTLYKFLSMLHNNRDANSIIMLLFCPEFFIILRRYSTEAIFRQHDLFYIVAKTISAISLVQHEATCSIQHALKT